MRVAKLAWTFGHCCSAPVEDEDGADGFRETAAPPLDGGALLDELCSFPMSPVSATPTDHEPPPPASRVGRQSGRRTGPLNGAHAILESSMARTSEVVP